MARTFAVATVALALDVDHKWLDNILSHYPVPGVESFERGIRRRVDWNAVVVLSIAHELNHHLSVPMPRALALASELQVKGGVAMHTGTLRVVVEIEELKHRLELALQHAVELSVLPRRGRPRDRRGNAPSPSGR